MPDKPLKITFTYGRERRRIQVAENARELWDIVSASREPGRLVGRALLEHWSVSRMDQKLDAVLAALEEVKAAAGKDEALRSALERALRVCRAAG